MRRVLKVSRTIPARDRGFFPGAPVSSCSKVNGVLTINLVENVSRKFLQTEIAQQTFVIMYNNCKGKLITPTAKLRPRGRLYKARLA